MREIQIPPEAETLYMGVFYKIGNKEKLMQWVSKAWRIADQSKKAQIATFTNRNPNIALLVQKDMMEWIKMRIDKPKEGLE